MKVSWLFEMDIFGENCIAQLIEEVDRQGMEAICAVKVPMCNTFPPKSCVVFYGSLGGAAQIRQETTWIPGVFNNPHNFIFLTYYPYFDKFLLAQEFVSVQWGDLITKKDFIYNEFGLEDMIFMRPNSGEKIFPGCTIAKEEFEETLQKLGPEAIVILSPPRNIEIEWRFVVADRRVITGSRYIPMRLRLREEDKTAEIFAQHVVDNVSWEPDRVWCLDICRTMDGNYYVVEINAFSCSGLYSCNPKPIVENVSRIAIEEWEKSNVL